MAGELREGIGRRRPGRAPRVSREQVLETALAIADERGLEGLTMEAIGGRLGVRAMSLYRHVANKDAILDGIVDLVFAEIESPPADLGWKAALRRRSASARVVLLRHPWAVGLMETRMRPGPANLAHHDAVLGVLLGAGFDAAMATHAYNLLDSFIFGFALQELGLPFTTAEELAEVGPELLQQVAAERYPNMHRVSSELLESGFDYGREFDWGLDLILDGIEAAAGRGRDPG